MSPLLFLAIAVVVPLLGMLVLGVSAWLKRNRITDDLTDLFRRRLEAIAPKETNALREPSGLRGLFRRRRSLHGSAIHEATLVQGCDTIAESTSRRASRQAPRHLSSPPPTSIRLVERDFSYPTLEPYSVASAGRAPSNRAAHRDPNSPSGSSIGRASLDQPAAARNGHGNNQGAPSGS